MRFRPGRGVPLVLAGAAVLFWSAFASAGDSSCVRCHLDEDMLVDNLKVVKAKKSAMQSGAG
ncbi:MAG: hypothetical protein Kow0089_13260 [Desulfobulbaceae bacterium]